MNIASIMAKRGRPGLLCRVDYDPGPMPISGDGPEWPLDGTTRLRRIGGGSTWAGGGFEVFTPCYAAIVTSDVLREGGTTITYRSTSVLLAEAPLRVGGFPLPVRDGDLVRMVDKTWTIRSVEVIEWFGQTVYKGQAEG